MKILHHLKGMSLLGVVMAVGVLGAMGLALPVFMAANQTIRTQQLHSEQAFYSAHALLEYQMRQIIVDGQGCNSNPTLKYLLGSPLTLTRVGGKVTATMAYGGASTTFSITDPTPPTQAGAMYVDLTRANILGNHTQLKKVYFGRLANCTQTLNIVSITISWVPNLGEKLRRIQIEGTDLYNDAAGLVSGSTFPLSSTYVIDNSTERKIDEIEMTYVPYGLYTFGFNMSDGSTITVSGTVL